MNRKTNRQRIQRMNAMEEQDRIAKGGIAILAPLAIMWCAFFWMWL